MTAAARSELYLEALRREFPGLRLVDKRGDAFSRVIDRALRLVTLGGQSTYLTRYVTTMGQTIYLPEGWQARDDLDRYCVLRHEAVHLRQSRRYGRVGMALLYLVPIVPLGLAWGRARLEWEAYSETLRATAEVRGGRLHEIMEQALTNLSERIPLTDLRYFIVSVLIQRDSGGNLTEVLSNLSRLIRERLKLMSKVKVLSSEGRLSAWILGVMPFALAGVMYLVNPDFMAPLWTDPIGISIIKYMLILMVFGILILRKIIRIHV